MGALGRPPRALRAHEQSARALTQRLRRAKGLSFYLARAARRCPSAPPQLGARAWPTILVTPRVRCGEVAGQGKARPGGLLALRLP
jgi:hypothetical protein